MPIYEYQCKACGRITEELQKISDPPLECCPDCGGGLSKLMSMNTFHLKGSGWYVTDYAHKNSTAPTAGNTDTAEKKTTPSTSETNTKPTGSADD
jgi:putative FmdB family regulatory protein